MAAGDRRSPKRPGLTREDRALWRLATRLDRPLPGRGTEGPSEPPVPPAPPPTETAVPALTPHPGARPLPAPVVPGGFARDAVPGLDRRTARRLRRGEMTIDDRIDLHGMTRERAHAALSAFVATARRRNCRCVLVITGKGRSPAAEPGVLRRAVPRWLAEAPLAAHVFAYQPARPRDGGDGALYLLLRRERD